MKKQDSAAKVQKIEAFQTTDDQIFEAQGLAEEHQSTLDRRTRIEEFAAQHFWSGIEIWEIIDALVDHGAEIGIE